MRKVAILFSLILIVFLAGCVGRTTVTGGQGVVITSFSPDSPTVDTGVPVTFTLVLENKGERTADKLIAKLFGLSDVDWKDKDGVALVKVDFFTPAISLVGADPGANIPGDTMSADLQLTQKTQKAVDTTYEPKVRVAYKYSTISESLLRVATSEYMRSVKGSDVPTLGVISSKTTAGPLIINVKTRTATIPPSAPSTTVTFEVQNTGGGRVFNGEPDISPGTDVLDIINWVVKSGDTTVSGCSGSGRLVEGKSKVITCQIGLPTDFVNIVEMPIKLELTYSYFVDSSTSVTVLKWLGGVPTSGGSTTPPVSTTPSISVSANNVASGQFSTIYAQTSDIKKDVTITFSTNFGSFAIIGTSPGQCKTDISGRCSVALYSAQAGTATVDASSTGYSSGQTTVTFS